MAGSVVAGNGVTTRNWGDVKQATLPAIARQQMHAVRSVADQVEKASPGAIHAVNFTFSGKRMQAAIIYNRDRGKGAGVQPAGEADEATPARLQPTKQGSRKPNANKAKGIQRPEKAKAAAPDGRAADAAMADADEAPAKAKAALMRRHLTSVITDVVQALGGDSTTGRQLLQAEKTPLTLFGYELRGVPLPIGSPAADMPKEELWQNLEFLYDLTSDAGDMPEPELCKMRNALTPRADKAPASAPAGAPTVFTPSRPARPTAAFMSWPGPCGSTASSSSPPMLFGGNKPTYGTGG